MRPRVVAVCGIFAGTLMSGCAPEQPPYSTEVYALRDRTVPPGGSIASSEVPHVERSVLRASWTVESPMRWEDYVAWVRPRFTEFREVERQPGVLRLSRALEADLLTLRFGAMPGSPGTRVVISFEGAPF